MRGLEESLRAILPAMVAQQSGNQERARLEVLDWLLEAQAPLTEKELERARREWQE